MPTLTREARAMSEYPFGRAPRRPSARRGRRIVRAVLTLVVIGAAFVLGVALGESLDDGPRAGKTVTYVRTLQPLPQQPVGSP